MGRKRVLLIYSKNIKKSANNLIFFDIFLDFPHDIRYNMVNGWGKAERPQSPVSFQSVRRPKGQGD